jgi:hypothetical protein
MKNRKYRQKYLDSAPIAAILQPSRGVAFFRRIVITAVMQLSADARCPGNASMLQQDLATKGKVHPQINDGLCPCGSGRFVLSDAPLRLFVRPFGVHEPDKRPDPFHSNIQLDGFMVNYA